MKSQFFVIADLTNYPVERLGEVDIESHVFDTENEDDIEILEEYLPTIDGVTQKELDKACFQIIDDTCDWGQRLVPYLILSSSQLKELKEKIQKL
jgi:hypothetical protein